MRIGAVPRRPNRRGALILLEKEMRAAFAVGRGHATVRGILAILHQLREDATNAITDPKLQDREVDLLRGKIDAMDEVEAAVEAELAASEEK
jgi:hypothetical protein